MTDECTHILLSYHFFKTIRNANIFQPLKGHIRRAYLIHSNSKFNAMSHQMENST